MNQPYKVVRNAIGRYEVIGPSGGIRGTYPDQDGAESLAESLNSSVGASHHDKDAGSHSPSPAPLHPTAFEVANFGDAKQGYVVFDANGGISKTFEKKADAEKYAAQQRKRHEASQSGLQAQLEKIAAKADAVKAKPAPWIPNPGEKGFIGPLPQEYHPAPPVPWIPNPGQKGFIGPLPQVFYQAPKPSVTPWVPSPGQPGFIGPLPRPTPRPGPTPWLPLPGQKGFIGPLPQSMTPQSPTPWVPSPGQKGFIGPLPQSFYQPPKPGSTPWVPSPGQLGFVGPLPRSMTPQPPSQWVPNPGDKGFIGPMPQSHYQPWAGQTAAQRAAAGISAGWHAYQGGSSAAGVAKAFTGGVGGMAGTSLGAAAGIGSGAVTVALEFAHLVQEMKAFSEQVVSSNARLSKWNGNIGTAYMMLAAGDFRRQVQMGRATQGTAITAVRAVDQMRDDWMGVDVLKQGIANRAAGIGATLVGAVGKDLSKIANRLNIGLDKADPNGLVGAGIAEGGYAAIKGFFVGTYDSFMNHPDKGFVDAGIKGFFIGQDAGAKAADAKVQALAAGPQDPNFWGRQLNDWAKAGPLLPPRRAPRP